MPIEKNSRDDATQVRLGVFAHTHNLTKTCQGRVIAQPWPSVGSPQDVEHVLHVPVVGSW